MKKRKGKKSEFTMSRLLIILLAIFTLILFIFFAGDIREKIVELFKGFFGLLR